MRKNLLTRKKIASNLIKTNSDLSELQIHGLRSIFEGAQKYARETGTGLDLKASNLYWDEKLEDWVLFDCGPRTSHLPFGFTTDLKSFSEYLSVWKKEEPDE